MKLLFRFLGLDFDPDRDGLEGPNATQEDRTENRTKDRPKDDKVHHLDSARASYKINEDGTWDLYNDATRTADITEADRAEWDKAGFAIKEDKYRKIKAQWAAGLSIKDTAKVLTTQIGRGYRDKTVEKYFVIINRAAGNSSSPTREKERSDRKTPQKRESILLNVQY